MPWIRVASIVSMAALVAAAVAPLVGSPPAVAATVPPTSPPTVSATSWSVSPLATVGASTSNETPAVSCSTGSFCAAVGSQGPSASSQSLAETWNGSKWSIVPTPNPTGQTAVQLVSVSCVGPSFCMSVGNATDIATSHVVPLTEMWNGATWSIVPSPIPTGSTEVDPSSVSCTSATFCIAAGASGVDNAAMILQWNGTAWSIGTPAAPTGATSTQLQAVTCIGTMWCLTVGRAAVPGQEITVAETWNGSTWTIVPTPNVGSGSTWSELRGVSCAGASFCQAVGISIDSSGNFDSLVETWTGSTWAITSSPQVPAVKYNVLDAVDCVSATVCTAVGSSGPSTTALQTMVLNWDGTKWTLGTSPNASGVPSSELQSISCITDWACTAGGTSESAGLVLQPFALTAPIARSGYRFVATDGGVFAYGSGAPFLGSMGGTPLNAPVVGMAVMPGGDGYYLVASDGGIFAFGSAQFYGSRGGQPLNKPIVGMAVTADGAGYWLVASDGGIFSYGDAQFYGSTGSITLNKPIVGMAATPDGKGYYLVASDGGIFNYGDAAFDGSTGSLVLNKPVVGMAAPVDGGYYLVASDGGIFAFPGTGGPPFFGSTGGMTLNKPIVGMTAVAGGYYISGSDGGIFTFPSTGGPPFLGSTGSIVLNQPIVGISG
jgi:hypothetical protein